MLLLTESWRQIDALSRLKWPSWASRDWELFAAGKVLWSTLIPLHYHLCIQFLIDSHEFQCFVFLSTGTTYMLLCTSVLLICFTIKCKLWSTLEQMNLIKAFHKFIILSKAPPVNVVSLLTFRCYMFQVKEKAGFFKVIIFRN